MSKAQEQLAEMEAFLARFGIVPSNAIFTVHLRTGGLLTLRSEELSPETRTALVEALGPPEPAAFKDDVRWPDDAARTFSVQAYDWPKIVVERMAVAT